ncbi:MAG: flagellar hook-basal body complex protein FliE [Thermaerobacter sp.]|nr:flagellar hook-basal body complex protein FliE [Thermaerobacter sp.]
MSIGIQGALQAAAAGAAQGAGAAQKSAGATFAQILNQAVSQVTTAQSQANQLLSQYAIGGPVTLEQVMLATSKAELLVETAGAVTTRAISAYQSLMQTNIG